MSEINNKCPGCGRQCDLSAPSCPRGEAYARGEAPDVQNTEHTSRGHHEHMGKAGNHDGHRHDHPEDEAVSSFRCGHEGHDRDNRGPRPPKLSDEQYTLLNTEEKLAVQLRELGHMSRHHLESKGGQGRILSILAQEGVMTQRVLTEKLGIQSGSASEVIGKLERAGLVERSENENDRRTSDVCLTELGRAQSAEATRERPDLFSALNEEEKLQLLTLLEKLSTDWKTRFPRGHHGHGMRKDHHHGEYHERNE
ncbi:MAG: MarR family transcriptional regulator [Oscillospiraceae bacterium]|nr:MarR family transcriptional regulator [Oscillospiraceae bacterium]